MLLSSQVKLLLNRFVYGDAHMCYLDLGEVGWNWLPKTIDQFIPALLLSLLVGIQNVCKVLLDQCSQLDIVSDFVHLVVSHYIPCAHHQVEFDGVFSDFALFQKLMHLTKGCS